jgi:hypothetical protein
VTRFFAAKFSVWYLSCGQRPPKLVAILLDFLCRGYQQFLFNSWSNAKLGSLVLEYTEYSCFLLTHCIAWNLDTAHSKRNSSHHADPWHTVCMHPVRMKRWCISMSRDARAFHCGCAHAVACRHAHVHAYLSIFFYAEFAGWWRIEMGLHIQDVDVQHTSWCPGNMQCLCNEDWRYTYVPVQYGLSILPTDFSPPRMGWKETDNNLVCSFQGIRVDHCTYQGCSGSTVSCNSLGA